MSAVLLALASGAALAFTALERYRRTSHGHNPWTTEGITNAVLYSTYIDRFLEMIEDTDGQPNSCYRSPEVNSAAGGVSDSRHLRALACDGKPARLTLAAAQDVVFAAAQRGELGPVRRVTLEPNRGIIHVEWWGPTEAVKPPVKSEWNG